MLFAIGAAAHVHIESVDIILAFLYGELEETIFMSLPRGASGTKAKEGWVVRLLKALYGLKHAPAVWYKTLSSFLKALGFEPCLSDPCVFVKNLDAGFFIMCIWVDDILMVTTSAVELVAFKVNLGKLFEFKDQGSLNNREYCGLSRSGNILINCCSSNRSNRHRAPLD